MQARETPHRIPNQPATPPGVQAAARWGRTRRNRQMRERQTAYIMVAFGLVLGGLELFIVLHYI